MKYLVLAIMFIAAIGAFSPKERASESAGCGAERIAIKSLDDPDATSVNFNPQPTTVEAMRAIPVPTNYDRFNDDSRYGPEKQVVTIHAVLVGWKLEADKDYHIVISDPGSADTMIIESIDPSCPLAKESGHDNDYASVREAIHACLGFPSRWQSLSGKSVEITGPRYLDPLHGQTGVATNGIEIHPILQFRCEP